MGKQEANATTLIPGETVAGYEVRPWSLAQLIELTEDIDVIATELKQKEITFDTFQESPMLVVKALAPHLPRLLSVTIRISIEDAAQMVGGDALLISLTIVRQNINHIRNLLGPASEALKGLAQVIVGGNLSGPSNS